MRNSVKILFLLLLVSCGNKDYTVSVEGGLVQGVLIDSTKNVVFRGIPYAAPPVGELRWKAPNPVIPWDGVRKADEFGPIGIQTGNPPGTFYGDEFYWQGTPDQSEDCLYLNVWTPLSALSDKSSSLPVALWIHGGAYANGYGYEVTMDGDAWASKGVILVTINYRLGVLGFLSHPLLSDEQGGRSGNYGLMDQIAALKWVRNNISAFGGDPDNITVFGQSAGAMSVKNLISSPESKELIAKAIIQSGGGLGNTQPGNSNVSQSSFDAVGQSVMEANDCFTLEQMRAVKAEDLLDFINIYRQKSRGYASFSPHFDEILLPVNVDDAIRNAQISDIPIMIGSNAQDMGGLGGSAIDNFCLVRESTGAYPAYKYFFKRNLPGDDEPAEKDPGAFHSAELWYTFHTLKNSWRPFTEADYKLSDEMVDAWTSFCKSGNPGWPAYTSDNPYTKVFDIE